MELLIIYLSLPLLFFICYFSLLLLINTFRVIFSSGLNEKIYTTKVDRSKYIYLYIYIYLFFFFCLTNSKIIPLSIVDRRRYTRRRAPIAIQTCDQLPNAALAFSFIDGTLYCSSPSLSRIFCQWELIRREEVNEEQKKRKSERWREHNPHNMQVLTNVRDVEWTKESTEFLSSIFIERWWSAVRPFYFFFLSITFLIFLFAFSDRIGTMIFADISVLIR